MRNPYAFLRGLTGLTQKQFCEQYSFAKQTLILIEQGVSPELSDRMVVSMGKALFDKGIVAQEVLYAEYGVTTLGVAYKQWRKMERAEVSKNWISPVPKQTEVSSPMAFLVRETIGSVQGFAKALKIPPATLVRYIKGLQREMPASVREALMDVGYIYLTELINAQAQWAIDHIMMNTLITKDSHAGSIRQ